MLYWNRRGLVSAQLTRLARQGEQRARWDGLDLEGADRDLKGHVARAWVLDKIHASIEEHVTPPRPDTACVRRCPQGATLRIPPGAARGSG